MTERTIFIESRCKLSYSNDYLKIDKDGENIRFHIREFDIVIFSALDLSCSLYTLNKLSANGKTVIFCDERKLPCCTLFPLNGTGNSFLRLREQLEWSDNSKNTVWKYIVETKLQSQADALRYYGCRDVKKPDVESGDSTNAEGRFANEYFNKIFGRHFLRHNNDNVNAALNYGYSILLSVTARIIASHGYNQALGVHHASATNNFNFACDIMEPFRPIIDIVVKRNGERMLDTAYKCELAHAIYENVVYHGKTYSAKNAIDLFFLDVVKCLTGKDNNLGGLKIVA